MKKTEKTENKKRKVKKNTWRRKLKAFDLRLVRRQREIPAEPADDDVARVCTNCGKEFSGRFCPQCGQDATWNRFSWKQEGRNMLAYLGVSRQAVSKTVNKVFKHKKKANKIKPVKKNTWRRKLKALDLKMDRRQQAMVSHPVADGTMRVCSNCGVEYSGRFCPQCGQSGTWSRFSWRQALMNVLDIWGLGSRPIFRTIRDLFWRPGYMVRDYLNGHRQYYFPPFKLLAVTLVLLLFVTYVVKHLLLFAGGGSANLSGLENKSIFASVVRFLEAHPLSGQMAMLGDALIGLSRLLMKNLLYEWLFIAIFFVLCIWVAHRRVGRYNFVETYIFLVFVLCQQWIVLMFKKAGIGLSRLVELLAVGNSYVHPSSFYGFLTGVFTMVAGMVSTVFIIYRLYLFVLDFRQFYGLSWKSTVYHLFKSFLFGSWLVFIGLLLLALFTGDIVEGDESNIISAIIFFGLIPLPFIFASSFLQKNKAQVNRIVSGISKASMLSVLVSLPLISFLSNAGYTTWSIFFMLIAYLVVTVTLSLLPVVLYKKYHRTWLAFIPLLLIIALVALVYHLVK